MDKPRVGYEKKYSEEFDKIFRRTLLDRIKLWIEKILIELFIQLENK